VARWWSRPRVKRAPPMPPARTVMRTRPILSAARGAKRPTP
jgi:hypothetical protein